MTWDKEGNLFCNWCGKTIIPAKEVDCYDGEINTGWTQCGDCYNKSTPYPKEGKIKDLPKDFNPKMFESIKD